MIYFDIDNFKNINDAYGHAAGDAVILALTGAVRASLRATDMLGRLGGEEFAILLHNTDLDNATGVAEKLHALLTRLVVCHDIVELHFSASFGVAELHESDKDALALIDRADALMYQAKKAGRDQVVPEPHDVAHLS